MAPDGSFVELVRIGDPIEADLFTAFLGDAEVEFIVGNRVGAGMMFHLMPRAQKPVVFMVREDDLERAQELLEDYRAMQKGDHVSSEIPEEQWRAGATGDEGNQDEDE
jgi:hypothetical protein